MSCFRKSSSMDTPKGLRLIVWATFGHLAVSLCIASVGDLDAIGFVGTVNSLKFLKNENITKVGYILIKSI
jgi:hypothetical protein